MALKCLPCQARSPGVPRASLPRPLLPQGDNSSSTATAIKNVQGCFSLTGIFPFLWDIKGIYLH